MVEGEEAGIIFEIAFPGCRATTPAMFLSASATTVENRMRKAMPGRYHDKRTTIFFSDVPASITSSR